MADLPKLVPMTYSYNDEDLKITKKGIPKYACFFTKNVQYLPIHIDVNGVHKFFDKNDDCNTILITGPPGIGKTSSILAGACHAGLLYANFGKDFQTRLKSKYQYLQDYYTKPTADATVLFPLMKLQGLQLIHEALLLMLKGREDFGRYINSRMSSKYVEEYGNITVLKEDALRALNESDSTSISAGIESVTKKINDCCEQLKVKPKNREYNLPAILHFDEVQENWVSKPIEKAERGNKTMESEKILDVGFICFTDAINSLVQTHEISFALTGTAMGMFQVIRVSSSLKPHKIELGCPELKLFLKTETNLDDNQIEQCKMLEGNPRGFHYFVQASSRDSDIQQCLTDAYNKWSEETESLYTKYERCEEIFDEIMLAMTFFDSFGGELQKSKFGQIVYKFPIESLPSHWLDHAKSGVLRLDFTAQHFYLYQPHSFLQKMMKEQLKILEFSDVMSLQSAMNDPGKRKGITFQMACALELSLLRSDLWKYILAEINKSRKDNKKIVPINLEPNSFPKKIKVMERDDEVKDDGRVYIAKKKTTGDIQIPNSFQTKDQTKTVKIFFECKNEASSFDYLFESGFFEKCASREIHERYEEIYILLSYEGIDKSVESLESFQKLKAHCKKSNDRKQFKMFFNVKNQNSTIGIRDLSEPQKISLSEFILRFPILMEISRSVKEAAQKRKAAFKMC